MKVTVDVLRCDAHGICVNVCPEVFDLDDEDDVVRVLVENPGESVRESVSAAARGCPKAAITVDG
jgi:ferredoxin